MEDTNENNIIDSKDAKQKVCNEDIQKFEQVTRKSITIVGDRIIKSLKKKMNVQCQIFSCRNNSRYEFLYSTISSTQTKHLNNSYRDLKSLNG